MADPIAQQGRCLDCGFDAQDWSAQDAARTFHHLGLWWDQVADGDRPHHDARWSRLAARLAEAAVPPGHPELDELHEQLHGISAAGRRRHGRGEGATRATGTVVAVNASGGGVPKLPVRSGSIGWRGLEGDTQAARAHHGRPWQALCLWSADTIDRLRREGHPIAPGSAGENLTVAGIDWTAIRPGVRVQAGEALIEVSLWAIPCKKNAQWFVDGDFNRISHERERGVSRMYGTVLRPGQVSPGDEFVVEPD